MDYGQFYPVARAIELLGEKWTLLIPRELHLGAIRFSELQRGLSLKSPTALTRNIQHWNSDRFLPELRLHVKSRFSMSNLLHKLPRAHFV
jgi:DNA-binding HxlR family transcriptional regulator